jgi:hypothetical protein
MVLVDSFTLTDALFTLAGVLFILAGVLFILAGVLFALAGVLYTSAGALFIFAGVLFISAGVLFILAGVLFTLAGVLFILAGVGLLTRLKEAWKRSVFFSFIYRCNISAGGFREKPCLYCGSGGFLFFFEILKLINRPIINSLAPIEAVSFFLSRLF